MKVYHATTNEIKGNLKTNEEGLHVASTKEGSEELMNDRGEKFYKMYEVEISPLNPLKIDKDVMMWSGPNIADLLKHKLLNKDFEYGFMGETIHPKDIHIENLTKEDLQFLEKESKNFGVQYETKESFDRVAKFLKSKGFDSIQYPLKEAGNTITAFVLFDENQVMNYNKVFDNMKNRKLEEDWETFENKRDQLLQTTHSDWQDALRNYNPYTDENAWEEIDSKSIQDSDGFWTDYTLYYNEWTEEYVCVFGDNDLYRPEYEDWDAGPFDTEEEAYEWFDSYNGFEDEDFDESLKEDVVKNSDGTWSNKGKEGKHGKFKTKKEAEAQMKAMYARGWKGECLKENLSEALFDEQDYYDDSFNEDDMYDDWQMGKIGKFNKYNDEIEDEPLPFECLEKEKSELKESSKSDFIDAYQWAYGTNKKEAQKAYKEFDPESRKELVHGFKGNVKKSFLTDSLHDVSWTATDIVRDLYSKYPEVSFIDERDIDDENVALFFRFGGNINGLEDLVKSYNCKYFIKDGKLKIIAKEDVFDECLNENIDYDKKYYCCAYYDNKYRGLEDDFSTNDMSAVEDWIWEKSCQGAYTTVYDLETGVTARLDPDDILDSEGEFDINTDNN